MPNPYDLVGGNSFQTLFGVHDTRGLTPFYLGEFWSDDLNCEKASTYIFRQEEIAPGHVITINRVKIYFKNLGLVTLTVSVDAMGQWDGLTKTASQTKTIGGGVVDGKIRSVYFDLIVTGERPQLKIFRAGGDGPLYITKVLMYGTDDGGDQL